MAARPSITQPLGQAVTRHKLARHRQRRDQLAAETLGAQLGRELVGDVPGEDDGAVGLVREHPALLDHRDRGAGHAFADLQRALDLADIVDDRLVEPDIVDQRRGARRRADAADARALLLDVAHACASSRSFDSITSSRKCVEPLAHGVAARLGGEHLLHARAAPGACPCAPHRRGSSRHGSGSAARETLRGRASRADA